MTTPVYELTGSMANIVSGDDLIFPNVQTCVAVACWMGGSFVGVHVTLGDRSRLSAVADAVSHRYGRPSRVYVVGPIFDSYNVSAFANFGCPVSMFGTPGYIDVRASSNGGVPSLATRPTGGGAWTTIPDASFLSAG